MTRERMRLVCAALLFGYAVAIVTLVATAQGVTDYRGRPLGTDFSNVYAAGQLALERAPEAPFDPVRQHREEQALFGPATPFYGWHYPPYFLLVAAPLAHLPYLGAFAFWQLATLALYLASLAMLLRAQGWHALPKDWILLALAFPAAFVNLTHGNNGFLTAALIAGGLALIERRPLVAGLLFGLLAYKPQFAILIPIALAAGGYWRTLLSGVLTVALLSLYATLAFGPDVWSAFFASTHFARTVVLEQGGTGFEKIQSVFAWTRLWGGPVALAYVLQGLVSVACAIALIFIWRGRASFADKGASLAFAALLATPYALDYDLVALAPAIALLGARGLTQGFKPYEKSLLALLWFVPIVAREIASATFIPIGPLLLLAGGAYVAAQALSPSPRYGLEARLSHAG